MQKSIDKIELGEKNIFLIRDKFILEMSEFNKAFEFPREKLEEVFSSAINQSKQLKCKKPPFSSYKK